MEILDGMNFDNFHIKEILLIGIISGTSECRTGYVEILRNKKHNSGKLTCELLKYSTITNDVFPKL